MVVTSERGSPLPRYNLDKIPSIFQFWANSEVMMSEVTDLVIPILQQIQSRLVNIEYGVSNIKEDMHHIKVRVSSLEENSGGLNRRLDKLDVKIDRIETRLGLI
jgi:hypothetical protein